MVEADPKLSKEVPDFIALMTSVRDQLARAPATVVVTDPETGEPADVTVGVFDLQLITANGLGSTAFLRALPIRYDAMSKGDFSWLAEEALEYRTDRGGNIMGILVDCASGASAERSNRIGSEAAETLLGNAINGVQFDLCDNLGNPDLGAEFRSNLQTEIPVLLISGSLDPRTPVANAEEVLKGLANGQHLLLEGVSHDFDLGDDLLLQYVQVQAQFLISGGVDSTAITSQFEFDSVEN